MISSTASPKDDDKPTPFPYLGIHEGKADEDQLFMVVVLFHDGAKGTVVFSDSPFPEHLFGTYREDWSSKLFKVYGGKVVLENVGEKKEEKPRFKLRAEQERPPSVPSPESMRDPA